MDAELRSKLDHALSLRALGNLEEAASELECLVREHLESGPVVESLGATYFMLDRYRDALPHCSRAVELRPGSETASLTLFHCFYALGRQEEAFREMGRYLNVKSSFEYARLRKEFAGDPLFERARAEWPRSDPKR